MTDTGTIGPSTTDPAWTVPVELLRPKATLKSLQDRAARATWLSERLEELKAMNACKLSIHDWNTGALVKPDLQEQRRIIDLGICAARSAYQKELDELLGG